MMKLKLIFTAFLGIPFIFFETHHLIKFPSTSGIYVEEVDFGLENMHENCCGKLAAMFSMTNV